MANCKNCKHFGAAGYINKGTVPFCFKNNREVLDTNTKKNKCKYFDYKYVGGRIFRKRKHNHKRRAGGGIR